MNVHHDTSAVITPDVIRAHVRAAMLENEQRFFSTPGEYRVTPLAVLSRDEALAKLYGHGPGFNALGSARRRRILSAVLEIRQHSNEGR